MIISPSEKDTEKDKGKSFWDDSTKSINLESPSESVVAEQQELLWYHAEAQRPRTPPPAQPRVNLAQPRPRQQAGPSHLPAPAPKPCPEKLDMIAALQAKVLQLEDDMEQKNRLLLEMIQGTSCPCADPKTCPCEIRAGHWPEWPDASEFMQGPDRGTQSSAASTSTSESGSLGPQAPVRRTHAVQGRSTGCVLRAPQSDTESEDGPVCWGLGTTLCHQGTVMSTGRRRARKKFPTPRNRQTNLVLG